MELGHPLYVLLFFVFLKYGSPPFTSEHFFSIKSMSDNCNATFAIEQALQLSVVNISIKTIAPKLILHHLIFLYLVADPRIEVDLFQE